MSIQNDKYPEMSNFRTTGITATFTKGYCRDVVSLKIRSHFHITWHPYLNKFLQVWRGRNMHVFFGTHQKYEYTQAKLIATNTEIFSREPLSFVIAPDHHDHGMTISRMFLKFIKVITFGNNLKIITSEYSLHCLDNVKQIFKTKFWIITAWIIYLMFGSQCL